MFNAQSFPQALRRLRQQEQWFQWFTNFYGRAPRWPMGFMDMEKNEARRDYHVEGKRDMATLLLIQPSYSRRYRKD